MNTSKAKQPVTLELVWAIEDTDGFAGANAVEGFDSPCHSSRVARPFSFGDKRIQYDESRAMIIDMQIP